MPASRGRGSKAKGSGFERKLGKIFTAWWTAGGLGGEFYRTPASGGLRWQKRSDVIGDLCTPEGFPFTIEAKNREDWDFKEFFGHINLEKPTGLWLWWIQAIDEAERAGRCPMLILKKNLIHPIVVVRSEDYVLEAPWPCVILEPSCVPEETLSVCYLSAFLELPPTSFFTASSVIVKEDSSAQ